MKGFITLFLILIISFPICLVSAQDASVESTSSLTFSKEFSIAQGRISIGNDQVSIDITPNLDLTFREDMILSTKSPTKYAEKGKSSSLLIEATNVVSSIDLSGDLTISLTWDFGLTRGSRDIPVADVNFMYSISETMGAPQDIILGDYLLFAGTIPVVGVYISLFMKPVAQYTPTLSGTISTQGPASTTPVNLNWDGESVSTRLDFTGTEPVSVTLSNPTLTLKEFKMYLKFSAVIAMVPIPAVPFNIVDLSDQVLSTSSSSLITYEPNLYTLHNELVDSFALLTSQVDDIVTTLSNVESGLTSTNSEINTLIDEVSSLATEITSLNTMYENLEGSIAQLDIGSGDSDSSQSVQYILDEVSSLKSKTQELTAQFDSIQDDVDTIQDTVDEVRQSLSSIDPDIDGIRRTGGSTLVYLTLAISLLGLGAGIYSIWIQKRNL